MALKEHEDAGVACTPRREPRGQPRSGWLRGSGPCVMERLLAGRRAARSHRVLNDTRWTEASPGRPDTILDTDHASGAQSRARKRRAERVRMAH